MEYTDNIRNFFIAVTILVIGSICFIKIGTIDTHAIFATAGILVPAIIVMGFLGQKLER